MGHVHADVDALATMGAGDLDEPVVMLNLLRYRETADEGCGVDGLSGRDMTQLLSKADR